MIYYSIHYNRPDFIGIQDKCIKKLGERLIVIDNSNGAYPIKAECERLNVPFYQVPVEIKGNPSVSHGTALNFLRGVIDYSEDWCIIDHDFFPLKKIIFENFNLMGIFQKREDINYLWPGFMAGEKEIILYDIDFLPGNGLDTGGGTRFLLSTERNLKVKYLEQLPIKFSETEDENMNPQQRSIVYDINGYGIHYTNGSEWMEVDKNVSRLKKEKLINFLNL